MSTAVDRFSAWLSSDVAPLLRSLGFLKSGATFHRRGPEGWGVINFQKSQFGTRDAVRFYINVGVALDRLLELDGLDSERRPPEYKCNWRSRAGHLTEPPAPEYWDLDSSTTESVLTADVSRVVMVGAVPFIAARLTEEGFVDALASAPRDAWIRPPVDVIRATIGGIAST